MLEEFNDPNISKKDLESFNSAATLKSILSGFHNLDITFPMWNILNGGELVAFWYTTGSVKSILSKPSDYSRNFFPLIQQMNNFAYYTSKLGGKLNKFPNKFPKAPGDLIKRLSGIDKQIWGAFILSFHDNYIPSDKETSQYTDLDHSQAWYDPGGDNIRIYVREIHNLIYEDVTKK